MAKKRKVVSASDRGKLAHRGKTKAQRSAAASHAASARVAKLTAAERKQMTAAATAAPKVIDPDVARERAKKAAAARWGKSAD